MNWESCMARTSGPFVATRGFSDTVAAMGRAVSFVRLYSLIAFFSLTTLGAKCNDVDRSRCLADRECPTGQGCFALPPGSQRCLLYCDAYASILCQDGTVCGFVPADDAQVGACLPGGTIAVGNNCSTTAECVKGAVCVVPTGAGRASAARPARSAERWSAWRTRPASRSTR